MNDDTRVVLLAEKLGWTYNEIMEQPNWLVAMLLRKGTLDSEQADKKGTN